MRVGAERPDRKVWSDSIVVAQSQGFSEKKEVSSEQLPFKILTVLKGPPIGRSLIAITVTSENLSSKPKLKIKGSRWILYIPDAVSKNGSFKTYRGAAGCVEYSERNLNDTLNEIENVYHEAFNKSTRKNLHKELQKDSS
jgi:hypothetical protein